MDKPDYDSWTWQEELTYEMDYSIVRELIELAYTDKEERDKRLEALDKPYNEYRAWQAKKIEEWRGREIKF